jgi:hypothetical protein
MKVIDLLNKIANEEEVPQKIKYGGDTYYYEFSEYLLETEDEDELKNLMGRYTFAILNDEVEIIEEGIEKLDMNAMKQDFNTVENELMLGYKINEIIDRLDKNGK